MKKDFLEELMDALREEEKEITLSAPVAPHKVIRVFAQVVKMHDLTWDEKRRLAETIMSFDGISPDEVKILNELDALHDTNADDARRSFSSELNEKLLALKDEQIQHTIKVPAAPHDHRKEAPARKDAGVESRILRRRERGMCGVHWN